MLRAFVFIPFKVLYEVVHHITFCIVCPMLYHISSYLR